MEAAGSARCARPEGVRQGDQEARQGRRRRCSSSRREVEELRRQVAELEEETEAAVERLTDLDGDARGGGTPSSEDAQAEVEAAVSATAASRTLSRRRSECASRSHPLARSTASRHRACAASAASRSPAGSKRRSRRPGLAAARRSRTRRRRRARRRTQPRGRWSRRCSGRSTGTPSWSACSWQSRSLAAAPPSTVREVSGDSGGRVSMTSRTSNAIASSVARTMCAARRAAGDADDHAARVRVPVGSAEPGERGHEDHAVGDCRPSPRSPRSRPPTRRSAARRAATGRRRR